MSVSPRVFNELQHLQFYFKKLYFLRWFIPTPIKTQLRALEALQMDAAHEREVTALLGLLCGSFIRPNWYTRIILYLFSGLRVFNQGELMRHVRELENEGHFSQDNIAWLVQQESLTLGVQSFRILHATGITPLDKKYQRLEQISKIMQSGLELNVSISFYKTIAAQAGPLVDYATAIELLKTHPRCMPYIKTLLSAKHVSEYARALVALAGVDLLPAMEPDVGALPPALVSSQQTFHKQIVSRLGTHASPLELAAAVLILQKNAQLEPETWEQAHTSEAPIELATLIGAFADCLDLKTLSQLEQHRKNLLKISQSAGIVLNSKQYLDLEYCQTLRSILDVHPAESTSSLQSLYDVCYAALSPKHRLELVQGLAGLSNTGGLEGPCGATYSQFLSMHVKSPHFWIYMELCTRFAAQLELATPKSITRLIQITQSCVRPQELLERMKTWGGEASITLDLVQATVSMINPPPTKSKPVSPEGSLKDDASTTSSQSNGLRQRHGQNVIKAPTSLVPVYAKPDADIEIGDDNNGKEKKKTPPITTPYVPPSPPPRGFWGTVADVGYDLLFGSGESDEEDLSERLENKL